MKIISIVGARPNFIKVSPFVKAIEKYNVVNKSIEHILVHSGQHYDDRMSNKFFHELKIPRPDINLNIGSGTHAEQVGNTMIEFEKVLNKIQPDWVVVFGDVNATVAAAITAKKLNIKVCHIEAGLRSRDESMPEEINRIVTDRLSDLLLTPDKLSIQNLRDEGVSENKIKFVGNIMIDTLISNMQKSKELKTNSILSNNVIDGQNFIRENDFSNNPFILTTMHRPSNVDSKKVLTSIIDFFINTVANKYSVIWPVHPRAEKQLIHFDLWEKLIDNNNFVLLHPLGYHDMLKLNIESAIVFTDSGGLQEECTVIGTPCLTMRDNTERPITLYENKGVCHLVGNNIVSIGREYKKMNIQEKVSVTPKYWDGKTADRCLKEILNFNQ